MFLCIYNSCMYMVFCGIEQILSSFHITKTRAHVADKWDHQSMLIKVHKVVLGVH